MLLISTALAGFYHPSDVAAVSERFATASEASAERATTAQKQARTLAAALVDYEEALDLLGITDHSRQQALQTQYQRDFAVLQAFVDEQVERFDTAFGSALTRALQAHPGAQRCERDVPVGRALPGMAARTERNPECKGDDLNETLAAAIDADTQLSAELAALGDTPWPELTVDVQPVPIEGGRWISAPAFFRSQCREALKAIRTADYEARLDFQVAIEQGASKAELEAMVGKARAVDSRTAAHRLAAAAPVLERASKVFEKNAPDAAWCPQPKVLGGCTGTEATKELADLLLADKKLVKALP